MTEGTPLKRRSPCKWIARDDEGRPKCEHGWAVSRGRSGWRCPLKARETNARYRRTDKGRARQLRWQHSPLAHEHKRRWNRSAASRVSKALYDLTRVRAA